MDESSEIRMDKKGRQVVSAELALKKAREIASNSGEKKTPVSFVKKAIDYLHKKKNIDEHIVKTEDGYRLVSKKTGKNLGDFKTKEEAEKREKQVQYFKSLNDDKSAADDKFGSEAGLDEISTETLDSYARKAREEGDKFAMKGNKSKSVEKALNHYRNATKRHLGAAKAEQKSRTQKIMNSWLSKTNESEDAIQTATITIPALIRICEICREDIKSDEHLHEFIEKLLNKADNEVIDSSTLEDLSENVIVSADKKLSSDGRLIAKTRKKINRGDETSLTGAKIED